jgi:hypothetical protein
MGRAEWDAGLGVEIDFRHKLKRGRKPTPSRKENNNARIPDSFKRPFKSLQKETSLHEDVQSDS